VVFINGCQQHLWCVSAKQSYEDQLPHISAKDSPMNSWENNMVTQLNAQFCWIT
jgi:hypothetical protein